MAYDGERGACGSAPKLITLRDCSFPNRERKAPGYGKVLQLPWHIRWQFVAGGAHVVFIDSLAVASRIPDYGGETSGRNSLLPHQDVGFPYLMLSKLTDGARGSSTFVMLPATAARFVRPEENFFLENRLKLGDEREYDRRFQISEEQYHRCFDEPSGYIRVVAEVLQKHPQQNERAWRLCILGYLMRGPSADDVLKPLVERFRPSLLELDWRNAGTAIIKNDGRFKGYGTYHLRLGGNSPSLKRNFCI